MKTYGERKRDSRGTGRISEKVRLTLTHSHTHMHTPNERERALKSLNYSEMTTPYDAILLHAILYIAS